MKSYFLTSFTILLLFTFSNFAYSQDNLDADLNKTRMEIFWDNEMEPNTDGKLMLVSELAKSCATIDSIVRMQNLTSLLNKSRANKYTEQKVPSCFGLLLKNTGEYPIFLNEDDDVFILRFKDVFETNIKTGELKKRTLNELSDMSLFDISDDIQQSNNEYKCVCFDLENTIRDDVEYSDIVMNSSISYYNAFSKSTFKAESLNLLHDDITTTINEMATSLYNIFVLDGLSEEESLLRVGCTIAFVTPCEQDSNLNYCTVPLNKSCLFTNTIIYYESNMKQYFEVANLYFEKARKINDNNLYLLLNKGVISAIQGDTVTAQKYFYKVKMHQSKSDYESQLADTYISMIKKGIIFKSIKAK